MPRSAAARTEYWFVRQYFVYILSSRTRRLYIGVTGDLRRRLWQHRHGLTTGFTRRLGITRLVHVELYSWVMHAIAREKQLKKWPRIRKVRLIERQNSRWHDLAVEWGLADDVGRRGE